MSKRNRTIQSSTVGAGFACPKTQSKLFSGERTSPLRTKRQHYPRFDNPFLLYRVTYPFLSLAGRGIFCSKSYHVENGVWQKLKIVLYLFNVIQLNKVGVRYFSFILFVCPSDMMRYIGCITSEFQYGNNIRLYRVTYHQ